MTCPNCKKDPRPKCGCGKCPDYIPKPTDVVTCAQCTAILQVLPDLTFAPATREQVRELMRALREALVEAAVASRQPENQFGLN